MNIALLAFNVMRPRGRDRLALSCGILGNGFALRRETIEAVPYEAGSVVEDLEYHLRLVRAGKKVQFADEEYGLRRHAGRRPGRRHPARKVGRRPLSHDRRIRPAACARSPVRRLEAPRTTVGTAAPAARYPFEPGILFWHWLAPSPLVRAIALRRTGSGLQRRCARPRLRVALRRRNQGAWPYWQPRRISTSCGSSACWAPPSGPPGGMPPGFARPAKGPMEEMFDSESRCKRGDRFVQHLAATRCCVIVFKRWPGKPAASATKRWLSTVLRATVRPIWWSGSSPASNCSAAP